jgi:hypothetical protein
MKTWYQIKAKSDKPKAADISIYDEIGMWGVSASAFMRDLRSMGELDEINLSIHSPGGDVLDGWAIYNALKNNKAKVTARVEGLAASMASVILMAADEIEIPENAYVMIHNPWGVAIGDAEELRDTAELIEAAAGLPGLRPQVLVPTARRAQEAVAAGTRFLVYVLSASEAHNRSNVRRSVAESVEDYARMLDALPSKYSDARLRGTSAPSESHCVSTCTFVPVKQVNSVPSKSDCPILMAPMRFRHSTIPPSSPSVS